MGVCKQITCLYIMQKFEVFKSIFLNTFWCVPRENSLGSKAQGILSYKEAGMYM